MLEVFDQRAILAFHVALGLRTIWDAGTLFDPQEFARISEYVGRKFSSVIRREDPWGPQEADQVLQTPDNPVGGFVTELVAFDEAREDVFEDQDVLETETRSWERNEIAHNMVEDGGGNYRLERSKRLWDLLPELVTDAAVSNFGFDILAMVDQVANRWTWDNIFPTLG